MIRFITGLVGLIFAFSAWAGSMDTLMFRATILPMRDMACENVSTKIGPDYAKITFDMSALDPEPGFEKAVFTQMDQTCDDFNHILFAVHLRAKGSVTLLDDYEYRRGQCYHLTKQFARMKFIGGPEDTLRGFSTISREAVEEEWCELS